MAQGNMRANIPDMVPDYNFWNYTDCMDTVPGGTGAAIYDSVLQNTAVGFTLLNKQGGQWKGDCGNSSSAANDSAAFFTKAKCFEFANGYSGEARLRITQAEANTNKAMMFIGFSSVVTSGLIVDTTGLPIATFDGFGLYKPNNQLFWSVINSVSTTQNRKDSAGTAVQAAALSASAQFIDISYKCISSTKVYATFAINGYPLLDASGNMLNTVWTYTGSTAMSFIYACKQGSTTRESYIIHKVSIGGVET